MVRQLRADGTFAVVIHLRGKPAQLVGFGNEVGSVLRTAACGFQGHRDHDGLLAARLRVDQIDHAGLGNVFRAVERPLVLVAHGQQIAAVRLGGHGDFIIPCGLGIRDLDGRRGVLGIGEAHRGGIPLDHLHGLRHRTAARHNMYSSVGLILIPEGTSDAVGIVALWHIVYVALACKCLARAVLHRQLAITGNTLECQGVVVRCQREGLLHVRGLHRDGAGLGGIVPCLVADRVGMRTLRLSRQRIHTICASGLLLAVPDELGFRRHHRDNHGGSGVGVVVLPLQNGVAVVDVRRCISTIRLAQLTGQRLQLFGGFAGDGRSRTIRVIAARAVCRAVVVAVCESISCACVCVAVRKAKAIACGSRYLYSSCRIAVFIGVFIAVAAIYIAREAASIATVRRYVTGGIAIRHRQRIGAAGSPQKTAGV